MQFMIYPKAEGSLLPCTDCNQLAFFPQVTPCIRHPAKEHWGHAINDQIAALTSGRAQLFLCMMHFLIYPAFGVSSAFN